MTVFKSTNLNLGLLKDIIRVGGFVMKGGGIDGSQYP